MTDRKLPDQTEQQARAARDEILIGRLAVVEHLTVAEIVERTKIPHDRVWAHLQAMEIEPRRVGRPPKRLDQTALRRADLAVRHTEFPTVRAAAEHYRVTTTVIYRDCRALGIRIGTTATREEAS